MCRKPNVVFAAEATTEGKHTKEVAAALEDPPSNQFDDRFPQNVRAIDTPNLARDAPHRNSDRIDYDGLPHVGAAVWPGQVYANATDTEKNKHHPSKLKGEEQAVVQQVRHTL